MQGILGIRDGVLKNSGKTNPSARDFVTFSGRGQVHDAIVGGPKEIADKLEEMFVERGCDGFVIAATIVPGSYADFVKHVVPELQRRGLFHKDYAGKTLRENLGLRRPLPAPGRPRRRPRPNKKQRNTSCVGSNSPPPATRPGASSRATRSITVSGDPFGEWQRTAQSHALKDVKIELPLIPRTFYCVGLNYLKHLKEAADKAGTVPNVPDRPEIGYRAQNALIAHDEDVVIPATATEKIHYEGELVVVIGKKAKHLTEANAMSCVFGYTIGNDVSERSWQKADRCAVALQERRHLQADGPVDRDRCRPRQDGNRRSGSTARKPAASAPTK